MRVMVSNRFIEYETMSLAVIVDGPRIERGEGWHPIPESESGLKRVVKIVYIAAWYSMLEGGKASQIAIPNNVLKPESQLTVASNGRETPSCSASVVREGIDKASPVVLETCLLVPRSAPGGYDRSQQTPRTRCRQGSLAGWRPP